MESVTDVKKQGGNSFFWRHLHSIRSIFLCTPVQLTLRYIAKEKETEMNFQNFKSVFALTMLVLMTTTSGCAVAGPELWSETFFDVNVYTDQVVTCHNHNDSLTITGPAVIGFNYKAATGELLMSHNGAWTRIRPLENQPSQRPTDDQIRHLQAIFPSVSFIDEVLAGAADPADPTLWFEAYLEWDYVRSQMENQVRVEFANNSNPDRMMAATTASQPFFSSELIVEGSVEIYDSDSQNPDRFVQFVYDGAMRDTQGVPVRTMVMLKNTYQTPASPATTISREDAKVIHDAIYQILESGNSVLVELGSGLRVNPLGR